MCGIWGIITSGQVSLEQFAQLGELNKARGNLGFGGYVADLRDTAVSEQTFHYPKPFDPELLPVQPANVALGHIRAPTGSRSNSVAEVHPFAVDDLLLAHNGLLLNHLDFPEWRLDTAVTVDSQIILGGIHTYRQKGLSISEAIAKTVSQLDGQQACWLWSKAEQMLYLWRVMSTVYVWQTEDAFVFSSTSLQGFSTRRRGGAEGDVERPSLHDSTNLFLDNVLLDAGKVYQFDFATMNLKISGVFEYYSPYL